MISRRLLFFVVAVGLFVAAAMAAAATTASGMPSRAARVAGTMTYTDPVGDAHGGPDVTTGTVTVDAGTGAISVTLNVPGYLPAISDGLERDVWVWLDTDRNSATGDPLDGSDYGFGAYNDSTGRYWSIGHWNGSKWESLPQSPTMNCVRNGDQLTWTMNASDLGGATGFRFYVVAGIWSFATNGWTTEDDAPDHGLWDYSVTGTPTTTTPTPAPPAPTTAVTLMISAPKMTPRVAVAGKQLTVSFPVVFQKMETGTALNASTGEMTPITLISWTAVTSGKMVCDPSIAGKVIAHSESLKGGQARLSFVIPKNAKGKLIKVSVKITATEKKTGQTATATKVVTFRVH